MAAADYTSLVQSIYISYFGRPADTFGLASFSAQLDALKAPTTVNGLTAAYKTNAGLKGLIDSFGTSAESVSLYGTDTVAFVTAIYANVLNRPADFDGLVFWVNAINSGSLTKGNASLAIMAGAVNNNSAQGVIDAAVLTNKVTIASNFTASIDTGAELSAYVGNAAAATARDMLKTVTATTVPATFQASVDATLAALVNTAAIGTTFTLTTAVTDAFVGTGLNDTFNASPATLNGFDTVDGGAGNDTLNLVDVTTGNTTQIAASVSIKNVESINITSAQAVTLNTAAFTGVTKTVIQAVGTVQVDGAIGATVATTLGAITIGNTTAATGDVVAKTTGAFAVAITGGANITTMSDNAVSITNATGKVAVTTTATASDITVKGGTTVAVTTAANAGGTAALATGITVGAVAAVATDATTGKQTISNLSSIAIGDITINNSSTTSSATTYGTAATKVYTNGAKSVVISGAGVTGITDVGTTLLAAATGVTAVAGTSTLTTVSLTGVSGATTIASNALTSLVLNGASAAVTATVVGAHALTIAAAAGTAAASVTDATATSVTLIATGTVANTLAVTAVKASSLTVGGDGAAFTMGALTLGDGVFATTIAVTGSVKADLSNMGAQAKLVSIDASANTGGVTASVGTATAFTGGMGTDIVTIGATTKAIVLGDGSDTAIVTVSALGTGGSITGGTGADTLSITGALAAAASLSNSFAGTVSGFETLAVTAAGALGAEVINLDVLGNYNSVTTGGAANSLSLQGMASGGTLKLTSNVGNTGSYTVGINGALASTSDVLNISLSKSGILAAGSVTAANVESINIVTADSSTLGGSLDSLTLNATSAKSIVVSGNAGLNLTDTGTALTSVDASGITKGGFTFTSGNFAAAATIKGSAIGVNTVDFSAATTAAVTYTGGTGADALTVGTKANVIDLGAGNNSVSGTSGNQTITAGAGDDTVTLSTGNNSVNLGNGANFFTATTGNNTYVGGTGVDTVSVGGGVNTITTGTGADVIIFTAVAANGNSYSTINDAHAGETISFAGMSGVVTLNAAPMTLAATAVFQDYLDAAATAGSSTTVNNVATFNSALSYFVFGGNTYIVEDNSSATTYQNGIDSVVKLVGIVDLSVATIASGIVTLH